MSSEKVEIELSRTDEQFGDFATNIALILAKKVSNPPAGGPREVAQQIADQLKHPSIIKVEVAGPGFINITLRDQALAELAEQPLETDKKGVIVIETNNPNPFKDMHIGHAYNSITADSIANLLELRAGSLHRVSYHGDVGLHVGKSMWAILRHIQNDVKNLDLIKHEERPEFMSRMYREGHAAYEEDEVAKPAIEELIQQSFSSDDPLFKQVYETCKGWSFEYFDSVLQTLGSKPIEKRYLESQADKTGREVVEKNSDTFSESDGATIFKGENYGKGLHTVVMITSRGNSLYGTRDLGLIQLKQADFRPDNSYIVTAEEQKGYFNTIFKAAELTKVEQPGATINIPTGTVKLASGKMSSRKGTFVNIGWLIEAITEALAKRSGGGEVSVDSVVGALRYHMLKFKVGSDVIIDINEAINLEGNSGPYLQYAHARACSVLAKSKDPSEGLLDALEAGERRLLRKISEYNEVVDKAANLLEPHLICTYLYELAQEFNRFYEHNRVVGEPREAIRLKLVDLYRQKLSDGLGLLGIHAPDKM